jgi:hypothetical protein
MASEPVLRGPATIVETACPLDCPDACTLAVTVQHGKVAGVASTLVAVSRARTLIVCEPSANEAVEKVDAQAAKELAYGEGRPRGWARALLPHEQSTLQQDGLGVRVLRHQGMTLEEG